MLANDNDLAVLTLSASTVTSREDRLIALWSVVSGAKLLDERDHKALLEVREG